MTLTLVYAAIFTAALVAVEAIMRGYFKTSERHRAVNHRLRLLEVSDDHRKTYGDMLKERGVAGSWRQIPMMQRLLQFYAQSGIKFDARRFALFTIAGALLTWLVVQFLVPSNLFRVPVFLLICLLVPALVVWRARARRMKTFELKLPEALDVANRSLAAGHPLPAAIALVAREMPDPIGTEFGLLSDELTYGVTLDDALVNLADRVGVEDLNLLAISLSVQAGTGGNLVEILQNLSKTLRDRSMLKAKVRAISSEGRITAIFMSVYPFLLYAMIKALSPTYFDPVWDSGHGTTVVCALLAVMAVGNVILYKMVNFEY
ncbi:type II secretion system F domain-containing protein (plasmid) [Rhizobium phaseoli]|uniref:Type II secretion system F domain-containing protein n=1 Tax=Rhizobium phaseoli TaxID=396 RepID=A0A192THK1_9HYPH|nr:MULTISPECIES: type II secretion system F family protein [Rhizobium]ANL30399.1 type II secretion system F domain-containing protein [Rhizobium phaseoli]ANL42825.1 type II secretion system F domain-containing protein [Rhizobium phaseoli]ANL55505.1 type II secretion system F domain-containing protein [Rhizobium phaseoli]ANL61811.1 type II secretion system F domain-containing protein [Rhizobium phaseoli]ANL67919.1 type II secretion system F domain-containing protein [Rhizobium phaseoli]